MNPQEAFARKRELEEKSALLQDCLKGELFNLLQGTDWYLTGIKVALESMTAFCEISELVYRGQETQTEGAWRLAHMQKVTDEFLEFAEDGQTAETRTHIMLGARPSLEILIRAFEGSKEEETEGAKRSRKTIITQLAADIKVYLVRVRSLRRMQVILAELLEPKYILLRGQKKEKIEEFHRTYGAFKRFMGYEDSKELISNNKIKSAIAKLKREQGQVETRIKLIHAGVTKFSRGDVINPDPEQELAEDKMIPVLSRISEAGFEYLERAKTAYPHSLRDTPQYLQLLERVSALEAENYELELEKLRKKTKPGLA